MVRVQFGERGFDFRSQRHTGVLEDQVEVEPAAARVGRRRDRRADVELLLGERLGAGERRRHRRGRRASASARLIRVQFGKTSTPPASRKTVSQHVNRAARSAPRCLSA